MMNHGFVLIFGLALAGVLAWGFRKLPGERWQMMAVVPLTKRDDGIWSGLNLTYYGFICAASYAISLSLVILLLGSCGLGIGLQMIPLVPILCIAVPSAKIMAGFVEKKKGTFTVGGASFAAIVVAPWILLLADTLVHQEIPIIVCMAAFSIAYTIGEALGRLACISFGCCYGKALGNCCSLTNKLFGRHHFVFKGKTKKIAYAAGLDGEKTIPIQGVTSCLYALAGLIGMTLFFQNYFGAALMLTLSITQVWRVLSEFWRADFRGAWHFSAYQVMALVSVAYMAGILHFMPLTSPSLQPDIFLGMSIFWQPEVFLMVQGFWLMAFLYMGRSVVTRSDIRFHVANEAI